jgi:hypothetical protein
MKVKNAKGLFCLSPLRSLETGSNAYGAISAESEECIRIVDTRVNDFVDVKYTSVMILVATTGVFLITRPIKITPREGQVLKVISITEVLNVLAEHIERPFAVGTATPLHLLQLSPNLISVFMAQFAPSVPTVAIVGEACGRWDTSSSEFSHATVLLDDFV